MNQLDCRRARRGNSILEIVISMSLMTILMLGLASSIGVASRSLPDGASPASGTLLASEAIAQFTADVRYATKIKLNLAKDIEFEVFDRNGDNQVETIRYRWSGTPGAALTRQVNGSPLETLMGNVRQFNLTYNTRVDPDLGEQLRSIDFSWSTTGNSVRVESTVRVLNDPSPAI